jgi:hypothetical protein
LLHVAGCCAVGGVSVASSDVRSYEVGTISALGGSVHTDPDLRLSDEQVWEIVSTRAYDFEV